MILFPRRLRFVVAFGILLLQVVILVTGNYTFFNLLTMVLCLVLFDDAALRKIYRSAYPDCAEAMRMRFGRENRLHGVGAFALLLVPVSLAQLHAVFTGRMSKRRCGSPMNCAAANLVNTYGLFAVMTTTRPEILSRARMTGLTGASTRSNTNPAM